MCTKIKSVGWLSMYARCVQLRNSVVGIVGSPRNPPRIPSHTYVSLAREFNRRDFKKYHIFTLYLQKGVIYKGYLQIE